MKLTTYRKIGITLLLFASFFTVFLLGRHSSSFFPMRNATGNYPQLFTERSTTQIHQLDTFPEVAGVAPINCKEINKSVLDSLAVRTRISGKSLTEQDLTRECMEYVVSDTFSVLDTRLFGQKILVAKYLSPVDSANTEENWIYQKVLEQMRTYPNWSYEVNSVGKDGKIYITYGGWEYLGWERSGARNFAVSINSFSSE